MRKNAFQCPTCGKVAYMGTRSISPTGWELKLSCTGGVGHPQWIVNAECFNCGKVPEYKTQKNGAELVPTLQCCNRMWTPEGSGPIKKNPFADERVI